MPMSDLTAISAAALGLLVGQAVTAFSASLALARLRGPAALSSFLGLGQPVLRTLVSHHRVNKLFIFFFIVIVFFSDACNIFVPIFFIFIILFSTIVLVVGLVVRGSDVVLLRGVGPGERSKAFSRS